MSNWKRLKADIYSNTTRKVQRTIETLNQEADRMTAEEISDLSVYVSILLREKKEDDENSQQFLRLVK